MSEHRLNELTQRVPDNCGVDLLYTVDITPPSPVGCVMGGS